ncbi:MAG: sigma-70 family RNA polymerase sigma factor, partial [Micrococcales bacterium]|nr:sigma-70 family RNA polymerase sigma factor [Micrococcales bacterium]
DANVEAWLITIARRRCVDALRARARHPEPVAEIAEAAAPASALSFDLVRALATLPDRQRAAVVLHFLVGLPHAEVARETDTTPEAARKASSEGIRTLRTVYRGDLT